MSSQEIMDNRRRRRDTSTNDNNADCTNNDNDIFESNDSISNNNSDFHPPLDKITTKMKSSTLDSVRKQSLLDTATPAKHDDTGLNDMIEKYRQDDIEENDVSKTYTNNSLLEKISVRKDAEDPLSNLSPSSMEVAFTDPHQVDHSSFEQRQSVIGKCISTKSNEDKRNEHTDNRPLQIVGTDVDNDNEEEKCRDEYIRSGTHFRALLDQAFRKVASGYSNKINHTMDKVDDESNERGDSSLEVFQDGVHESRCLSGQKRPQDAAENIGSRPPLRRRLSPRENEEEVDQKSIRLTAQLARDKMSEVLSLKRALKEAEEHSNAMSHANATLREASASSTARIQTLTESLRITSSKVASSRADADMAKAKVTSLSTQMKSLQAALDETNRVCESIREEHDDIQNSARTLEAKLVQTESELERVDKEKFEMKLERDEMRQQLQDYNNTTKEIRIKLEKREDELLKLKKKIVERDDIEHARKERLNRLENELRDSRSMLVEATSASKDSESTNADLQSTVQHLQRENKSLHGKIEEIMESSMREKAKLQETLAESESVAQKLRMKATNDEEELQRAKLDQAASEKEIEQLKNRISDMEGRLQDAISSAGGVVSPPDTQDRLSQSMAVSSSYETPGKSVSKTPSASNSVLKKSNRNNAIDDDIPPLRPSTPKTRFSSVQNNTIVQGKENRPFSASSNTSKNSHKGSINGSKSSSAKCSICFKNAYGIMKSCQCGNVECEKRAHASCFASSTNNWPSSVSHPGTPAPRLPCILCRGV